MAKESQGIISYISTTTAASTNNVLGEVVSFNGPSMNNSVIGVTHLGSTAKKKLPGVYDGGQLAFGVNALVTDIGQTKAREMLVARTKGAILIQIGGTVTSQKLTCKGYMTGINFAGAVDAALTGDIAFEIDGGVSFST